METIPFSYAYADAYVYVAPGLRVRCFAYAGVYACAYAYVAE